MDYRDLCTAIAAMNDEQLVTIEKKAVEERRKRTAAAQSTAKKDVKVLIDLAPLVNSIREAIRQEMSIASEPVFAAVLDQLADYPTFTEEQITHLLSHALTATYLFEANCEMQRRMPSSSL